MVEHTEDKGLEEKGRKERKKERDRESDRGKEGGERERERKRERERERRKGERETKTTTNCNSKHTSHLELQIQRVQTTYMTVLTHFPHLHYVPKPAVCSAPHHYPNSPDLGGAI